MGDITFIIGGARSGKSNYAQELAQRRGGSVVFIATAEALDEEMAQRIKKHQSTRPGSWCTVEIPYDLAQYLNKDPIKADIVILDCLTLLVSNILMRHSKDIDNPPEKIVLEKCKSEVKEILLTIEKGRADWIIVSNEVGMGLVPSHPAGRIFRDLLGEMNKMVAQKADEVLMMLVGIPLRLQKQ